MIRDLESMVTSAFIAGLSNSSAACLIHNPSDYIR